MNLYFCEGCGRRLSDEDLAEGKARNKKLRGVYCSACSIGVTTMDTIPMKDDEAQALVKKESSESKSGAGRRASSKGIPVRRSQSTSGPQSKIPISARGRAAEQDTPSRSFMLPVAIGLIAGVVGLALLMGGGDSPKRNAPKKEVSGKDLVASRTADNAQTPDPVESPAVSQPHQPQPVETPPDSPKSAAKDEPAESVAEPADADKKAQPDEGPVPKAGPAEPEKKGPQTEQKAPAKPDATPKTTEASRQKEARVQAARALETYLDELDLALRHGEFKTAAQAVEKAGKDDKLKPIEGQVAALAEVWAGLAANRQKLETSRKGLLDGKARVFSLLKRQIKGTVSKHEETGFRVQIQGMMNGKPVEYSRDVKWVELKPDRHADLLGLEEPENPKEWMVRVLESLGRKDMDAAQKGLTGAKGHPLVEVYEGRVKHAIKRAREENAELTWMKLKKLGAAPKLSTKVGNELLSGLDAFVKDYGNTAFFKTVTELGELKKKAMDAVAGFAINDLFKGKVESFDPKTRNISLLYNFADPAQGSDWQGDFLIKDGALRAKDDPQSAAFHRARFVGDVELRCSVKKTNSRHFVTLRFDHLVGKDWHCLSLVHAVTGSAWKTTHITLYYSGGPAKKRWSVQARKAYSDWPHFNKRHFLRVDSKGITFRVGDKVWIGNWTPVHKQGHRMPKNRGPQRVGLVLAMKGETRIKRAICDQARIVGTLHGGWLNKALVELRKKPRTPTKR